MKGDDIMFNQQEYINSFIKDNYKEMYMKWSEMSDKGYYKG